MRILPFYKSGRGSSHRYVTYHSLIVSITESAHKLTKLPTPTLDVGLSPQTLHPTPDLRQSPNSKREETDGTFHGNTCLHPSTVFLKISARNTEIRFCRYGWQTGYCDQPQAMDYPGRIFTLKLEQPDYGDFQTWHDPLSHAEAPRTKDECKTAAMSLLDAGVNLRTMAKVRRRSQHFTAGYPGLITYSPFTGHS